MRQMEMEVSSEEHVYRKRCSAFFVKDILGLSDDSESESIGNESSDENCQREDETHTEYVDDGHQNNKKTRQCFTSKQVEELERLFNETNYPDAYTRQMLAKKMKVSETRIQIWCQNRRAKIRRQRKQRKPMLAGLTTPHSLYYQTTSPWMHSPHYTLPLHPILPLSARHSPIHSPIHSPVSEKSRLFCRTELHRDDMSIEHMEYTRTKMELEEYHGRMRSLTR